MEANVAQGDSNARAEDTPAERALISSSRHLWHITRPFTQPFFDLYTISSMPIEAAGPLPASEAASGSTAPKDAVQDNSSQRKRPRKRKRGNREDDADVPLPLEKQPLYTPWLSSLGPTIADDETKEQRYVNVSLVLLSYIRGADGRLWRMFRLHDEIVGYAGYILPTTQEKRARDRLISRIENVLKRRFPDGIIHVYGSVSTNLCLPNGDIDVVIETRGVTTTEQMKNGLYQVRNMLQRADLAASLFVVSRARVPVINMVSTPETGSFNIDITINGLEGVQAISIIKDYLAQMPALRYLILVLKCLFEQHNLHSAATGGLSSYASTCMVISFLQLNPAKRSKEFLEQPVKSKSLGVLLMDLLKYYGDDFPYIESCISVRDAELKSKEAKVEIGPARIELLI
ncbi:hypothetical protein EWM64_g1583 [Hericium alpestre]|uniref:polynucleotide adenylyltransferase n=1 Tax=Hericium alpestre TaxID=135208 RepID=A0A4Z0A840_9AGAM|nr:hypothetical protein EWM64_g1583 [Hericium alpestre]